MSPWIETRLPRWPLYAGIGVIVAGIVVGYLLMTGAVGGGEDPGEEPETPGLVRSAATSDSSESADEGPPALQVVSWGHAKGQLAVVVRNESGEPITAERVRITALDSAGDVLASTTGTPDDVCCTIVGLPPGRYFGLFANLDPMTLQRTADVAVERVPEAVAGASKAALSAARIRVDGTRLQRLADDTVVSARLTTRGTGLSGYVAAQAFLVGRDGRVVQVISGRFYCFGPGQSRTVRMQLLHAAPPGVRLDRVVAYVIPDGVPAYVPGECRS